MREREQPHLGEPCDLRRLGRGRMERLTGAFLLLGREGRLVHEQVGMVRRLDDARRGCRVAGEHDLSAGPPRPEHRVGRDHAPVGERQRLASLEDAPLPPGWDADRIGGVHVEAPRPLVLDEGVADGGDAVVDGEGVDPILAPLERLPGLDLDERQRVRQPAEERAQLAEQVLEPLRPVHRQPGLLAAAKRECLQHPRQAEEVVGVQVREEDLLDVGQADHGPLQLPLRALGAVEEELLAAAPQQERRRCALRRRHRGRRAEKEKVEIHAGRL